MSQDNPLFILGNPRSGTSLFRIMLTSHPLICIPPECGFIQWWYSKYKDWSLKDSNSPIAVDTYISDLKTSKKIETWNLNFLELKKYILKNNISNYSNLCLEVLKQFAKQQEKQPLFFGDKNNYYLSHLELLNKLFPKARYILIVRDGRDVTCSYKNLKDIKTTSMYKPNLSTDIKVIANEWLDNNKNTLSFFKALNKCNYFTIRYENLLMNTKNELSEVCDFLQIPFNEMMLDYSNLNKEKNIEPEEMMSWKKKTYQKPDISNIGKYKKELTSNEIDEFNSIAKEMLLKFNYE